MYLLNGCDGGGGGIKPETNLHGGLEWNRSVWRILYKDKSCICLSYTCPGFGGFTNTVEAKVTYRVLDNTLRMEYEAEVFRDGGREGNGFTSEFTPLSLTNHAYWNLSAGEDKTIHSHSLKLFSDAYAPDDGSGDGVLIGEFRSAGRKLLSNPDFVSM